MKGLSLRLLAASATGLYLNSASLAIARWNGDALGGGNNPPAQNVNLPAAVQNTFVRILLGYSNRGSGIETQVFGSGIVLGARRDGPNSATGRLCVLTGFHNTEAPATALTRIARVFVAFGNGNDFRTNRFSVRYTDLIRPPANNQGRAPDLTVIPIQVNDWAREVPAQMETSIPVANAAVDNEFVMAGFGRTGVVDVPNREYDPSNAEFGTMRTGTNTVDALVANTTNASPRTTTQFEYASIRSNLDFTPGAPAAITFGQAHFLNSDSGGPTIRRVENVWSLIGIHSDSVSRADQGVDEGMRQWDVRAWEYRDWIRRSCNQALVPEPGTFVAIGLGASALLARRRR
jgi:hypothetical protein